MPTDVDDHAADRAVLPLVGREEECRRLDEAVRILDQHGLVALVIGPSGIGKSRLVGEWTQKRAQLFHAIVRVWVTSPSWEDLMNTLAEGVSHALQKSVRVNRLSAALENLTKQGPMVFLIEDAHHLGEDAATSLVQWLYAQTRLPILFLLTWREAEEHILPAPFQILPSDRFLRLPLRPLTRRETEILVRHLLTAPPPRAFLMELHANAHGNPLLIREGVRVALQHNLLYKNTDGAWIYRGFLNEFFTPDASVQELARNRWKYLSDVEKQTLKFLALFGPVVSDSVIQALRHTPELRGLHRLLRQGLLLFDDPETLSFSHPSLYEVAREETTQEEAQAFFRTFIRVMASQSEPDHVLIARLIVDTQTPLDPSWLPTVKAVLPQLTRRGLHKLAIRVIDHLLQNEEVLDEYHRLFFRFRRATILRYVRSRKEGIEQIRALLNIPQLKNYPRLYARVLLQLIEHELSIRQNFDQVRAWFQELEGLPPKDLGPYENLVKVLKARLLLLEGQTEEAVALLKRILQTPGISPVAGYLAATDLGEYCWQRNELPQATEYFHLARVHAEESGNLVYLTSSLLNLCTVLRSVGRYREWLQTVRELLEVAADAPLPTIRATARMKEAELLMWEGEWDQAYSLLKELVSRLEEKGHTILMIIATLFLIDACKWSNPHEGLVYANKVLAYAQERYPDILTQLYNAKAMLELLLFRPKRAQEQIQLARKHIDKAREYDRLVCESLEAYIAYQLGESADREAFLEPLRQLEEKGLKEYAWGLYLLYGVRLGDEDLVYRAGVIQREIAGIQKVKKLIQKLQDRGMERRFIRVLERVAQIQPDLEIYVLGQFRLLREGKLLHAGYQMDRNVIALLAIHEDRQVSKDELLDWLWDGTAARKALTNVLYRVRQVLGDLIVEEAENLLQLHPARVWVDLWELRRHLKEGHRLRSLGKDEAAEREFEKALELYKGDLLPGFYHRKIEEERAYLRSQVMMVASYLFDRAMNRQDPLRALHFAQFIRKLDPLAEEGFLQEVHALTAAGMRSKAQQEIARFQELLREEELSLSPEAEEKLREWGYLQT